MINLLRVFVSPGTVFESMRSYIPAIPPLVTLVLGICIFHALQAWYLSDDEYLRVIEASAESTSEMSKQMARGDRTEEEIEEFLAHQREMTEEQLKAMTSEDGIQSARKVQTVFSPATALFSYGLLVLLEAPYFLIAGNMMRTSRQWSD